MHATGGALLASLFLVAAVAAGGSREESVELEVLGVVPLESEAGSLLVLREKNARTVLPLFVGKAEGSAIEGRLQHERTPRGSSGDLLERSITALGGKVLRVEIHGAQSATFTANVSLQQGERRVEVEARPSDSVALAIAASAPIFTSRAVLAEAGVTDRELTRAAPGAKRDAGDERLGPVTSF